MCGARREEEKKKTLTHPTTTLSQPTTARIYFNFNTNKQSTFSANYGIDNREFQVVLITRNEAKYVLFVLLEICERSCSKRTTADQGQTDLVHKHFLVHSFFSSMDSCGLHFGLECLG